MKSNYNQAVAMNPGWREQGQAGPLLCATYRKVLWNSQRTEHIEASCRKSLILASEVSTSLSSCHSSRLCFPLSNNQEVTFDMDPHLSGCYVFGTSPLIIRGTHTRTWRGSLELVQSTSKVMTWSLNLFIEREENVHYRYFISLVDKSCDQSSL